MISWSKYCAHCLQQEVVVVWLDWLVYSDGIKNYMATLKGSVMCILELSRLITTWNGIMSLILLLKSCPFSITAVKVSQQIIAKVW